MSASDGPSSSLRVIAGFQIGPQLAIEQLRVAPSPTDKPNVVKRVREAGLEPAASRLSAGCSNRLSYPRNCNPGDSPPRHKIDGAANGRINAQAFTRFRRPFR